jgi:CRISPR-associated protein Cas5t
LNLAGIETRLREEDATHQSKVPATLQRAGLPAVKLAVGVSSAKLVGGRLVEIAEESDRFPRVQTVYQQLHNYPVGSSGGTRADTTFGNKYNITPVRRELLIDLRAVIVIDENAELERRVRQGLAGQLDIARYGLPFLGDNAFLPDRIELLNEPPAAHWYERISSDERTVRPRTTRLTVWIDRADYSRTKSELYSPGQPSQEVPDAAWTVISPP